MKYLSHLLVTRRKGDVAVTHVCLTRIGWLGHMANARVKVMTILFQSVLKCRYDKFHCIAFKIHGKRTVVPGFRALGPSTAKSALNPGSALFPRLDLEHFVL